MKKSLFLAVMFISGLQLLAQDTITLQTLTFDSTGRKYYFDFPKDDGTSYEKILMEYTLRCKDALISTSAERNKGCGEWDYSCNTFITDPTMMDSVQATAPSYSISGFEGENFSYSLSPTKKVIAYTQKVVSLSGMDNGTISQIGIGIDSLAHPFGHKDHSKSTYLYTKSELEMAGASVGNFSGITLNFAKTTQDLRFLKIKMKSTTLDVLDKDQPDNDGFEEVYFKNTNLTLGDNSFEFYKDFDWDGSSNVLVEISYSNTNGSNGTAVVGHSTDLVKSLISSESNSCIQFNGNEYIDIPVDGFDISDEITISLWSFGNPDKLPRNTTIVEGVNDNNERQVNIHFPWNNSRIYWDCGTNNRIDKAASKQNFAGQWNHWAFTKNATTGIMKIYLNGKMWSEGSGKTALIDLKKMRVAASKNYGFTYYGAIDEFRVWNKALTSDEIKNWMYKSLDDNHPSYQALKAYYQFDEGNGLSITDLSLLGAETSILSNSTWKSLSGENIFKDFEASMTRPNMGFIQDDRVKNITDVLVYDTLNISPNMVISYQVENNDLMAIDTIFVWESGYEYVYDVSGLKIDSSAITTDETIDISTLNYYKRTPMEFEIMSFVTPYGIGLDLGENGKTFTFDVSDFAPILMGNKQLDVRFGNYQEEMDIKFKFIKGTPVRKVLSIQQIWKAGQQRNFTVLNEDRYFEERSLTLNPDAGSYKIRAAVTGHGQQGEFIPRSHYININGGDKEMLWEVWKKCSDNPVYPQGGTWIYARAGWCPGAATDLEEFEISEFVAPGDEITLDYGIDYADGDSRYLINCQLVSYAEASFQLDAAITDIIKPTKNIEGFRFNPVCHDPAIVIQNTGSEALEALTITYGVVGGKMETQEWKGYLELGESKLITLSVPNTQFWLGSEQTFVATVSNPNDGLDTYGQNNTMTSPFVLPDMYDDNFVISLFTNKLPNENSYTIRDVNGDVVHSKTGFVASKVYRDSLKLPHGCYTLEFKDKGNNGLHFWADPNQGKGSLKLRSKAGDIIRVFNPDFGNKIRYSFSIGDLTNVEVEPSWSKRFDIYPNPSDGEIAVDLELELSSDIELLVMNNLGMEIYKQLYSQFKSDIITLELKSYPRGIYYLMVKSKEGFDVRKLILE